MHICCLNMPQEYYSPISGGAVATVMMQQTRELIARGHRVSVLTPMNGDETYGIGEISPVRVGSRENLSFMQRRISDVRRKMYGWDWPYYEYYLSSFLKAMKHLSPAPDVVIVHNDLASPQYIKKALPGAKVIVWLHNEWRTHRKDTQALVDSVDQFVAVSKYIRDWTAKTYDLSPEKITNVPNGVDLEVFKPREDFLQKRDSLRVLYIGRIDPNKGPDIAADAVRVLQEEGLAVKFAIAGAIWWYGNNKQSEDPYFQKLKAKMDSAQAEYLGLVTRPHVPELIRQYDVVCVLSRSNDPYPLVPQEAMASGCAVIASDRGGLPEACGGAGMLADPDDFETVVNHLRLLATDPEALKAQKRKSVERAARASWTARVDLLEQVLARPRVATHEGTSLKSIASPSL